MIKQGYNCADHFFTRFPQILFRAPTSGPALKTYVPTLNHAVWNWKPRVCGMFLNFTALYCCGWCTCCYHLEAGFTPSFKCVKLKMERCFPPKGAIPISNLPHQIEIKACRFGVVNPKKKQSRSTVPIPESLRFVHYHRKTQKGNSVHSDVTPTCSI